MRQLPDTSNFYSSLYTDLSRDQVAGLFGAAGWEVRKAGWHEYEVVCSWAELVIEAESPMLLHGPVADVTANAQRIFAVLEQARVAFTAESYGPGGGLLQEWKAGCAEPGATADRPRD